MIENSLYRWLKEGFTIWISQRDSWGEWLPCTITCFWLSKWCKTLKCWIEDTSRLRENKWSGLGYSYLPERAGAQHTHAPENWGNLLIVPYLRLLESTHTHTHTLLNSHTHNHKYTHENKHKKTHTKSYESRNCLFISSRPYKCLWKYVIMADYIQAG